MMNNGLVGRASTLNNSKVLSNGSNNNNNNGVGINNGWPNDVGYFDHSANNQHSIFAHSNMMPIIGGGSTTAPSSSSLTGGRGSSMEMLPRYPSELNLFLGGGAPSSNGMGVGGGLSGRNASLDAGTLNGLMSAMQLQQQHPISNAKQLSKNTQTDEVILCCCFSISQ